MEICVQTYNLEKVFYFTQNSLVKAALEKKEKIVLSKAYQELGCFRGSFRTLSNI